MGTGRAPKREAKHTPNGLAVSRLVGLGQHRPIGNLDYEAPLRRTATDNALEDAPHPGRSNSSLAGGPEPSSSTLPAFDEGVRPDLREALVRRRQWG